MTTTPELALIKLNQKKIEPPLTKTQLLKATAMALYKKQEQDIEEINKYNQELQKEFSAKFIEMLKDNLDDIKLTFYNCGKDLYNVSFVKTMKYESKKQIKPLIRRKSIDMFISELKNKITTDEKLAQIVNNKEIMDKLAILGTKIIEENKNNEAIKIN